MLDRIKEFFSEIRIEFKKVTWPSRDETIDSTKVVIVVVVVIAFYLSLVDLVLSSGVKRLLNDAPAAVFSVSPTSGDMNTTFQVDASGSYDSEESSSDIKVRWDFDGDGKWDEPADGFTKNKVTVHKFSKPGSYYVRLEVRDSQGASSIAKSLVEVKPAVLQEKPAAAEESINQGAVTQTAEPGQTDK